MPDKARRPVVALVLSFSALVTAAVLVAPTGTAAPLRPLAAAPSSSVQPTSSSGSASGSATGTAGGDTAPVDNSTCQWRETPPPPVDTSEKPAPGAATPTPLPVPATPVGGDRMGQCGLVLPPNAQQPPDGISAASWLIADLDSGDVLATTDPHGRQRPAALVKVLLANVVLKELNLAATVTATAEDANQEGSKTGLVAGVGYTVEQLLQALLMDSGNDVAHALARQLGGTTDAVRKMNAMAKELGALDTRVATPSGLDGPGMVTSAYDSGLIFRTAMANPKFKEALATERITLPGKSGKTVRVVNDNKLLASYDGALGGKSGATDDAGSTFVGAAEKDGRRLLVVLLRGDPAKVQMHVQASRLLDYGFELSTANMPAVGVLVDEAPTATNAAQSDGTRDAAQQAAGQPAPDQMSVAFGNVGMPLTVAAGVFLVVALLMYLRKRRARAARAARAAAGNRP
ncbi:D-alanyl-D-alanine carboxypeptidase family protein [Goodfellowiella coeruleoviolacea]|uniref:D-alanyl-D-alanine carboxypeptidase family protein n=1 Tax=Goodfellowiella coeruleoviolacea TaxID=334858 RepID=UPI0020A5A715|nr:serine hydrolase [Goodfellowiella coeruleoviolacea]